MSPATTTKRRPLTNPPAEDAGTEPKKAPIPTDEVKQLQVSHWDFDYMTTAPIEQALREKPSEPNRDR